jgi:hypothetical protein
MAAPSAMAAPEHSAALSVTPPVGNASEGCSRDVCIYLNTPGDPHPGESAAKGWLYTTTYFGRFHLTGPGGLSKYSAYQAWVRGRASWVGLDSGRLPGHGGPVLHDVLPD